MRNDLDDIEKWASGTLVFLQNGHVDGEDTRTSLRFISALICELKLARDVVDTTRTTMESYDLSCALGVAIKAYVDWTRR